MGGVAGHPGGHAHGFGVHGKVNQRAPLEFKDRLARIAILPVLADRILQGLAGEGVFELQGGNGNSVQAQSHIEGFF